MNLVSVLFIHHRTWNKSPFSEPSFFVHFRMLFFFLCSCSSCFLSCFSDNIIAVCKSFSWFKKSCCIINSWLLVERFASSCIFPFTFRFATLHSDTNRTRSTFSGKNSPRMAWHLPQSKVANFESNTPSTYQINKRQPEPWNPGCLIKRDPKIIV